MQLKHIHNEKNAPNRYKAHAATQTIKTLLNNSLQYHNGDMKYLPPGSCFLLLLGPVVGIFFNGHGSTTWHHCQENPEVTSFIPRNHWKLSFYHRVSSHSREKGHHSKATSPGLHPPQSPVSRQTWQLDMGIKNPVKLRILVLTFFCKF